MRHALDRGLGLVGLRAEAKGSTVRLRWNSKAEGSTGVYYRIIPEQLAALRNVLSIPEPVKAAKTRKPKRRA